MSALRQMLRLVQSTGIGGRHVRRIAGLALQADRTRSSFSRSRSSSSRDNDRDDGRHGDRRTADRPRNRYLDPQTVDREADDDTRSLGERRRIRVEYTPDRDGDPDPGEVVWTWIPYEEDPTNGKDRPAIIIGRSGDDLVGVPLTTKKRADEYQVEVGTGEWDSKRRTSHARIDRVMAIDPDSVRREGAILPRDRFDAVVHAVDERFDIVRVT